MKFAKINYKKLLSTSLIILQVTTLSGCMVAQPEEVKAIEISVDQASQDNSNIVTVPEMKEEKKSKIDTNTNLPVLEETISEEVVTTKPVKVINEPMTTNKEKKLEDFLAVLDSMPTIEDLDAYYMEHFVELNNVLDENAYQIQLAYAAAAYKKLINANINISIIMQELHNVIVEQQVPRGMDDKEWKQNFGNITTTLNPEQSLFDTYFCLAYMIHDYTCDEVHTQAETNGISCKVLVKEFQDKYKQSQR